MGQIAGLPSRLSLAGSKAYGKIGVTYEKVAAQPMGVMIVS